MKSGSQPVRSFQNITMIARILAIVITAAAMALPANAATLFASPKNGPRARAAIGAGSLPSSADKVQIRARFVAPVTQGGTRALVVQLTMARGWHVNAHPASLKFLIATRLSAHAGDAEAALDPHYPPGVDSGITLGGAAIKVYDDDTKITATLRATAVRVVKAAGSMTVVVRVQACGDQGVCLSPSRLDSRVQW